MMEFTMSRAVLMFCGLLLMSAVLVPYSNMLDGKEYDAMDRIAESDARMIDSFCVSGLDEMYLKGSTILPSQRYHAVLDGYFLTIYDDEGNEHIGAMKNRSERITVTYGDTVSLVFDDGKVSRSA